MCFEPEIETMATIWDGIVVGGAGGAIAGLTVWLVQYARDKYTERNDKNKIYQWLQETTTPEPEEGPQFRSTRAIASWNNLTQDRVRYICSIDTRIHLSTGKKEDVWGIHSREERSVYEKRGIQTL